MKIFIAHLSDARYRGTVVDTVIGITPRNAGFSFERHRFHLTTKALDAVLLTAR
jgi:hypothetical protein